MDRAELIRENNKLLERRKVLGITHTKTMADALPRLDFPSTPNYSSNLELGPIDTEFIAVEKFSGSRQLWDSLDVSVHDDLRQAKLLVQSWYKSGMSEGYSCLLAGNVGCGKSHIARAILEAMTPFKAVFIEETDFIKQLQATYGNSGSSEHYIIQNCVEADLLIYDDLGAYQTRNLGWIENIYRMIFEQRLAHRKPVLITTNLSFTNKDGGDFGLLQDHIGPRNYDRLLRGILTPNGPYYASLFNVPSYQMGLMSQYLEQA